MFTIYLIGGLVLIVALIGLAIYSAYRAGFDNGYEDGRADAYLEIHPERTISAMPSPRHAKSQPRVSVTSPAPSPAAAQPEPKTSLVRSGYRDSWFTPGRVELPAGGAIGVFLARHRDAVTAEDIGPVELAAPSPAPDLNGAADTGTMPKVELAVGDTGEMRAITDAWISEHIRSEAIA